VPTMALSDRPSSVRSCDVCRLGLAMAGRSKNKSRANPVYYPAVLNKIGNIGAAIGQKRAPGPLFLASGFGGKLMWLKACAQAKSVPVLVAGWLPGHGHGWSSSVETRPDL
jgi:hypothetical protein